MRKIFKKGDAITYNGQQNYYFCQYLNSFFDGIADCSVYMSYNQFKKAGLYSPVLKNSTRFWFADKRHVLFEKTRKMTNFEHEK